VRTRFAPSPTGDLHLGGALTALASWWLARSAGGTTVLRVEDIDRPRVVPGSEERQRDDLAWLGLDWDEEPGTPGANGPYRQTERAGFYEEALAALTGQGRVYPCDCSRAEIARVASAPHEGEEIAYPGTCRDKDLARPLRRPPALRLRIDEDDEVPLEDGVVGRVEPGILRACGDFVLRRGDGVYAYQLAVSADDLAMGITGVVRGEDLIPSTPRQLLLMQLWRRSADLPWARDRPVPRYWHLPLVRAADGSRLAKRTPGSTVRDLRELRVRPEDVVGRLAHALGLAESPEPISARELARKPADGIAFRSEPWSIPARWA
jgi:glutamyl-tRNA synthetase